jgi:acyl dehydratase
VHIDIDKAKAIRLEPMTVPVERGRLAFFAKATGQTDPVYSDLDAAKAAGHPDLPVPPTFFFSLELEDPNPFGFLDELGVDQRRILHGEQAFTYHGPVHAGDTVTLHRHIVDVLLKKGGALQLLLKRTEFTRGGELVAESTATIAVPNPEAAK